MANSLSPIYKVDSKGNDRVWQADISDGCWRTRTGTVGGKLVESEWTVCFGKQGRTAEQQAFFEANSERTKKLKKGYTEFWGNTSAYIKPMLAASYNEGDALKWPVYSQPKLDGIRAIATKYGLYSRAGNVHKNVAHINAALAPIFAVYPNLILDGELYSHAMKEDFGGIVGAVKREAKTPLEKDLAEKIEYHIYDVVGGIADEGFNQRYYFLQQRDLLAPTLRLVPTTLVSSQADCDRLYSEYLRDGYEGQMLRIGNVPYEGKRSKSLLKRKTFDDAEFPIIAIHAGQGNWAGYAKSITVLLPDGTQCDCGMRGNQSNARDIFDHREEYEEQKGTATVRFFGKTPDGKLRFPVSVGVFKGKRDV